jgi:hypothetical protein
MQRNFRVLGAQPAYLVVDVARLHGTAAGAVDAQHDTLRVLVLERGVERENHLVGARLRLHADHALQVHQRRVLAGPDGFLRRSADPAERTRHDQEKQRDPEEPDENRPLAGATLLVDCAQRHLFERGALPAGGRRFVHGRCRLTFAKVAAFAPCLSSRPLKYTDHAWSASHRRRSSTEPT